MQAFMLKVPTARMHFNQSIGSSIKDNRRLVTFSIEKPEEFVEYLKTRYPSELRSWIYRCPKDDWKYPFLVQENKIRILNQRIKELEKLAEVW
jgi:hypothetical protein